MGVTMKPDEYRVMEMAVEEGVKYGFARAYKYHDAPNEDQMQEAVISAVMGSICDWFNFPPKAGE